MPPLIEDEKEELSPVRVGRDYKEFDSGSLLADAKMMSAVADDRKLRKEKVQDINESMISVQYKPDTTISSISLKKKNPNNVV